MFCSSCVVNSCAVFSRLRSRSSRASVIGVRDGLWFRVGVVRLCCSRSFIYDFVPSG
uniref:Uncharacterized protein n=1 Tax=Physcomitrium patens TaxID=3218 RepID=A0A2K1K7E0_PHYPA|nr:hypothetical protein PHYPA_011596 [Physcomitrium patens]